MQTQPISIYVQFRDEAGLAVTSNPNRISFSFSSALQHFSLLANFFSKTVSEEEQIRHCNIEARTHIRWKHHHAGTLRCCVEWGIWLQIDERYHVDSPECPGVQEPRWSAWRLTGIRSVIIKTLQCDSENPEVSSVHPRVTCILEVRRVQHGKIRETRQRIEKKKDGQWSWKMNPQAIHQQRRTKWLQISRITYCIEKRHALNAVRKATSWWSTAKSNTQLSRTPSQRLIDPRKCFKHSTEIKPTAEKRFPMRNDERQENYENCRNIITCWKWFNYCLVLFLIWEEIDNLLLTYRRVSRLDFDYRTFREWSFPWYYDLNTACVWFCK